MKSNYQDLIVWQKAIKLVTDIYILTNTFPKEEIYGITSQIRRAAISIPLNIAEGSQKATKKDFRNFLKIAKGSTAELETQLIIVKNLNYIINRKLFNRINFSLFEIRKMLSGLHSNI